MVNKIILVLKIFDTRNYIWFRSSKPSNRGLQLKAAEEKDVCSSPVRAPELQLVIEESLAECWDPIK